MMKILFPISLLLLASCAGIQPISNAPKQQYRPRTQKELLLEKYRLMRAKNWDNLQEQQDRPTYRKITIVPKHEQRAEPKIIKVDEKEQEIEIGQNLSYFCMDKRKESRFQQENACAEFTENIYSVCLDEYEIGDARLTRCVKSRLR